jgi:hypothetical protein
MRDPQERAAKWVVEVFGDTGMAIPERCRRFIEEAVELVQSTGMTVDEVRRIVDYVFSRPVGDPPQEIGGTMVTLYALSEALGLDVEACAGLELQRIEQPEVRERCFAKQQVKVSKGV